ncbi:MAG: hypothetical protein IKK94_02055 [Clostridia bacterium]|nr:hypothetical protein [Clostridia bacterium]
MKRLLVVLLALLMLICLSACGDGGDVTDTSSVETEKTDRVEEIPPAEYDAKLTINGDSTVYVSLRTNLADFSILRPDKAGKPLTNAAIGIKDVIKNKLGAELAIKTDWDAISPDSYQIVVGNTKDSPFASLIESFKENDFAIKSEGNKIYIIGGSETAIVEAANIFIENFIYAKGNAILTPVGEGYMYIEEYMFDKLTIGGIDISEFKICTYNNETIAKRNKVDDLAREMRDIIQKKLCGIELPIASDYREDKNYIVIDASSLDANEYSVKFENGSVFITGNYISIDKAVEEFYTNVLGYTEGSAENGKTLDVGEDISISGSMGYTVPYTKADMLELFDKVYKSDKMVLSGQHTFNTDDYTGTENGSNVGGTRARLTEEIGDCTAILELDVGSNSPYTSFHAGVNNLYTYDLAKIVAESMEFVSDGGIIAVCMHLANPLMNDDTKTWYDGNLESKENAKALLTKGTELNKKLDETLEPNMRLLKALDDNGIPFMFRPLHEMNAIGFWWSTGSGGNGQGKIFDAELFTDFWKYIYNKVTVELGIDDAVWVYAPNNNWYGTAETTYSYPGDKYDDIVGVDWYGNGRMEYNEGNGYEMLIDTGKPVALTEFGVGDDFKRIDEDGKTYYDFSCDKIIEYLKTMMKNGHGVTYFLTWTHNMSLVGYYDGISLMRDPLILSLSDMPELWADIQK